MPFRPPLRDDYINSTPLCPNHAVVSQSDLQLPVGLIGHPGQGYPRTSESEASPTWNATSTTLPSTSTSNSNNNTCCSNNVLSSRENTVWRKILTGENFDEWASGKF